MGHIENLVENINEVDRLLSIHTRVTGDKVGRRHGVEVLNKSAVVLLTACWEAFVEDLAVAAFDHLIAHANRPDVFPPGVLVRASSVLRKDNDERRVWKLAGDGWKSVLADHRDEVLKRHVSGFNTPRPKNVDALFESLVGIPSLSGCWTWHKMSAAKARQRLEELVTLRGEIAHRVSTPGAVHKARVEKAVVFVKRLSINSSNTVRDFAHERTGEPPWPQYKGEYAA